MSEEIKTRLKFNANIITAPSLFLSDFGPKILLIGSSNNWKTDFVKFAVENWVFDPINIFYDEDYDLPWIWSNCLDSDFHLFHIEDENPPNWIIILLGYLANRKTTYLSIDPSINAENIRILWHQMNGNIIENNQISNLSKMKLQYESSK